jgi:hypothetical protein
MMDKLPLYCSYLCDYKYADEIKKIIDDNKCKTIDYSVLIDECNTDNIKNMLLCNDYIIINGHHELTHLMENNISLYVNNRDKLFFVGDKPSKKKITHYDHIDTGQTIKSAIQIDSNNTYHGTSLSNLVQHIKFTKALEHKYSFDLPTVNNFLIMCDSGRAGSINNTNFEKIVKVDLIINKYYHVKNIIHYVPSSTKHTNLKIGLFESITQMKKINHVIDNFPNKISMIVTNSLMIITKLPINVVLINNVTNCYEQKFSKILYNSKIKKIKLALMIFNEPHNTTVVIKNNVFDLIKTENKKNICRTSIDASSSHDCNMVFDELRETLE